jgi:hypothetical protein
MVGGGVHDWRESHRLMFRRARWQVGVALFLPLELLPNLK